MPANSNVMNIECEADTPQWFAICTKPKQEDRAYHNLQASSVECFNSKIKECRHNQFTGAVTLIARPLFPRYIFARFRAQSLLRRVRFIRGVLKVVSFNSKPTPIDNEVLKSGLTLTDVCWNYFSNDRLQLVVDCVLASPRILLRPFADHPTTRTWFLSKGGTLEILTLRYLPLSRV